MAQRARLANKMVTHYYLYLIFMFCIRVALARVLSLRLCMYVVVIYVFHKSDEIII
jgi:hypothetical protein